MSYYKVWIGLRSGLLCSFSFIFEVVVLVENNPVPCRSSLTDCTRISLYFAGFISLSTFTSLPGPAEKAASPQRDAGTTTLRAWQVSGTVLLLALVWQLKIPILVFRLGLYSTTHFCETRAGTRVRLSQNWSNQFGANFTATNVEHTHHSTVTFSSDPTVHHNCNGRNYFKKSAPCVKMCAKN